MSAGKAQLLREKLARRKGVKPSLNTQSSTNSFIETEQSAAKVLNALLKQGILGGLDLGQVRSGARESDSGGGDGEAECG